MCGLLPDDLERFAQGSLSHIFPETEGRIDSIHALLLHYQCYYLFHSPVPCRRIGLKTRIPNVLFILKKILDIICLRLFACVAICYVSPNMNGCRAKSTVLCKIVT